MSKINKYQLTENYVIVTQFYKLYTNTTIANFNRPVFSVFFIKAKARFDIEHNFTEALYSSTVT